MAHTPEDTKKRQERLGQFDCLMGIIDRWTDDTSGIQGSTFKHLREGALVRETVVTPGVSVSVARLKSFLAMEILKIYPWGSASNISWLEIRRRLAGETEKQYGFYFGELDNCFTSEKNTEAALRLRLLRASAEDENGNISEDPEDWGDVPVYLLDMLQKRFQDELGKYWKICDRNFDEQAIRGKTKWKTRNGKEGELGDDVKMDVYMDCVTSLALREIFVRNLLEDWGALTEEAERQTERLKEISGEMEETIRQLEGTDRDGKAELEGRMADRIQESAENIKWQRKFLNLRIVCTEHLIRMGADLQVIMFLEKGRLEELTLENSNSDSTVRRYLDFIKTRHLINLGEYNKNRKKYYDHLTDNVKRVFGNSDGDIQQHQGGDVSKAVETYLRIVMNKNRSDVQDEEIWEKQNRIAGFLWNESSEAE